MEGKETVQTLKGIGKKQKSVARKKSDYVMNSRVSKLFCFKYSVCLIYTSIF